MRPLLPWFVSACLLLALVLQHRHYNKLLARQLFLSQSIRSRFSRNSDELVACTESLEASRSGSVHHTRQPPPVGMRTDDAENDRKSALSSTTCDCTAASPAASVAAASAASTRPRTPPPPPPPQPPMSELAKRRGMAYSKGTSHSPKDLAARFTKGAPSDSDDGDDDDDDDEHNDDDSTEDEKLRDTGEMFRFVMGADGEPTVERVFNRISAVDVAGVSGQPPQASNDAAKLLMMGNAKNNINDIATTVASMPSSISYSSSAASSPSSSSYSYAAFLGPGGGSEARNMGKASSSSSSSSLSSSSSQQQQQPQRKETTNRAVTGTSSSTSSSTTPSTSTKKGVEVLDEAEGAGASSSVSTLFFEAFDEQSFERALEEFDFVFVVFHAPWCSHCKGTQEQLRRVLSRGLLEGPANAVPTSAPSFDYGDEDEEDDGGDDDDDDDDDDDANATESVRASSKSGRSRSSKKGGGFARRRQRRRPSRGPLLFGGIDCMLQRGLCSEIESVPKLWLFQNKYSGASPVSGERHPFVEYVGAREASAIASWIRTTTATLRHDADPARWAKHWPPRGVSPGLTADKVVAMQRAGVLPPDGAAAATTTTAAQELNVMFWNLCSSEVGLHWVDSKAVDNGATDSPALKRVRIIEASEEVDMVTYINHKFVAVGDGGTGLRLFTFVMTKGVKRFVISNCTEAATIARKSGVQIQAPGGSGGGDSDRKKPGKKRKKKSTKKKSKKEIIQSGHS